MLSKSQAQARLQVALPQVRIVAGVVYKDVYLFRVEYPSEAEKDYDPFFSVHFETGEVRDFSVITDGDISEITRLFTQNERR